ncbi:MAG: putative phage tail protein [Anaerovoracaceae bacterium]
MRSDNLKRRVNKLNVRDPMVQNVLEAIGQEMDLQDQSMMQTIEDLFFDTCSMEQLKAYEKEADITPLTAQDVDGRRSTVEGKWKSSGKVDVAMLQAVANSWKNGKVDVDFADNKIQITFVDQFGLPDDRAGLEIALDDVKPAHLPIIYLVRYLMVADMEEMTLTEMESHMLSDFAFE